ncbi:MAG: DctP family TRAP transporter solute-binding subunit [Faecalicatena sp.]|uniref:DctP family TRAP transporter solute-binding subunit n=1 Tax=Faecalicatena sp. TaxID=2005360 RepID=UPI00259019C8|nr:DctP family TRAP transporter solute-binding subunit [Faecalicatena sp.]MCI6465837.1 DctP family TRAP transporter solute-binding subunit [Faecalicatena sp.]MDY5618747.1 DctP family TRAP transporter solute-binding subunit [Lachnospiraceae bacterium]
MKRWIACALAATLTVGLLSGCQGSEKAKSYSIKVGYGTNPGHPIDLASNEFEKQVEKEAKELGYDVDVQLFPSSQLGSEKEMIELLQIGALDMCPTTTGPLGLFEPPYLAFDLPFLFLNSEQADRVLDGDVGTKMLSSMEDIGIVGLAWWENGFRELTNNKRPITKPEDLKGIKLRTMQNDVHIDFFQKMGAAPTPLGFGEIYTSLQSNVIDGQENPLSIIATNKFYEVQPYTTISDHVYSPVPVLYSKALLEDLPKDLQEIVKNAAYDLRIYEREAGRSQEQEYIDEIAEKSEIYVLSDEEKKAFQDAAQSTYEKFESVIGKDFMDEVLAEAQK